MLISGYRMVRTACKKRYLNHKVLIDDSSSGRAPIIGVGTESKKPINRAETVPEECPRFPSPALSGQVPGV